MNRKVTIQLIIILLLITYYCFAIYSEEMRIYFNQYDIIGQYFNILECQKGTCLSSSIIDNFLSSKSLEEITITKVKGIIILLFNLIGLSLFASYYNKNYLVLLIIIYIYGLMPYFNYRFYYGHTTLMILGHIFLNLNFINKYFENKNSKYIVYSLLAISFSFFLHGQLFIYHCMILMIYIVLINKFDIQIIKRFKKTLIFLFIVFVLYCCLRYQIYEPTRYYSIETINKYSIINPLEIFYKFNGIYPILTNLIDNEYLNINIIKFQSYIDNYGANGPEFTFFYGINFIILLFMNLILCKKSRLFWISIITILGIVILTLNSFYFFSLVKLNYYLFPMVRSVSRVFLIIDIIYLINWIYFSRYCLENRKYLILVLLVTMTTYEHIKNNFNYQNYNNEDFIIDKKYLESLEPSDDMDVEGRYILNYLINKNSVIFCELNCKYIINIKAKNKSKDNLFENNFYSISLNQ